MSGNSNGQYTSAGNQIVSIGQVGSASISEGQTTMANSFPVVLPSDQTGIGTRTSPNVNQDQMRAWLQNGQMFSLSTGLQASGGSGGNFPLAVFNPSNSGKNLLIFSVAISANIQFIQAYITYQTSNPNFASSISPSNMKMGGAGTVATCTTTSSSVSIVGTGLDTAVFAIAPRTELLSNAAAILLPSGSANAIIGWIQITNSTATNYAITIRWIEY